MTESFFEIGMARWREVLKHKERYLEAWVAETGLLPSECILLNQTLADGTIRIWVEKRPDKLPTNVEYEVDVKRVTDLVIKIEGIITQLRHELKYE